MIYEKVNRAIDILLFVALTLLNWNGWRSSGLPRSRSIPRGRKGSRARWTN